MARAKKKQTRVSKPVGAGLESVIREVLQQHEGQILNNQVVAEVKFRTGRTVNGPQINAVRKDLHYPLPQRGGGNIQSRYKPNGAAQPADMHAVLESVNEEVARQAFLEAAKNWGFAAGVKTVTLNFDPVARKLGVHFERLRVEVETIDLEVD